MIAAQQQMPSTYMLAPAYFKNLAIYPFTISEIIKVVCGELRISPEDIKTKGRQQERVFARQVICYVAVRLISPRYKTAIVGRALNLDHATVIYSHRKIQGYLDVKSHESIAIEKITNLFKNKF